MSDTLIDLCVEIGALLAGAAERSGDDRIGVAAERTTELVHAPRAHVEPCGQAVVDRWLAPACEWAGDETRAAAELVLATADRLSWFVPYADAAGDPVIDRLHTGYAVALLAGPAAESYGDSPLIDEHFMLALTLQAPDRYYPEHHHTAVEVYSPLAGTAHWLNGSLRWRVEQPGAVIVHDEDEIHAMTTVDEPLLTYVAWITDPNAVAHLAPRGGPAAPES